MSHVLEAPVSMAPAVPFGLWRGQGLSARFQPIYQLGSEVLPPVAAEGLSRGPAGTAFESPAELFSMARSAGFEAHLDRLCIRVLLTSARLLPVKWGVFLNVHPRTLCYDCGFPAFLASEALQAGIAASRITLEVIEHARVAGRECDQLHTSLEVLRDIGVKVAVDDVGCAADEARRALAFRPDYLKLDGELVRRARADMKNRAILQAIVDLAQRSGAQVIAEGIEEACDLELATTAGIELAQGYLMCRPLTADALAHGPAVADHPVGACKEVA